MQKVVEEKQKLTPKTSRGKPNYMGKDVLYGLVQVEENTKLTQKLIGPPNPNRLNLLLRYVLFGPLLFGEKK